jgi:hypothetical protein
MLAFLLLFRFWILYAMYPIPRPTFFSDPLRAFLLLTATAASIAGGVVGVFAGIAKGERSITVLLSVVLGAFVLFWTIWTICLLLGL